MLLLIPVALTLVAAAAAQDQITRAMLTRLAQAVPVLLSSAIFINRDE